MPAAAQETTGTLTGRVTDAAGTPVAGVVVRVTRDAVGFVRETTTGSSGTFVAAFLPPGTYDVTFTGAGSPPVKVREVPLHVGDRLAVDAVLGAAESERRWTSGERAAAPTPAVQYVVTARQIEALPLINRHVSALAAVMPGVTSALRDEPSFLFSPADGLDLVGIRFGPSWFLDGAPPLAGDTVDLAFAPSLESLEEVRFVAASPSATWPRGAAVALVTRSGTNTPRASVYEFHRDGSLDANSYFRNLSLDPTQRAEPADLRSDIFGYSAGGPIRRDRTFAFVTQEWRRRRGETEDDALDGRQETARIDQRAGARTWLMARYTHDTIDVGEAPARGARLGAGQATTVLSATVINQFGYRTTTADGATDHALADTVAAQRGAHALAAGGVVARDSRMHYEAFAQDSWRAHRALTVDLGLRRGGTWEAGAGVAWRPSAGTVLRGGIARARVSTPMRHFCLGFAQRLYARGSFDAAYVGTRADAHVHEPALRYDGLLAHFRHEGPAGLLDVAYTVGRDQRLGSGWERAYGERRHVFVATYLREVGGFTFAGITTLQSGPPANPVTIAGRSGAYARPVGDPFLSLPSDRYYFSPAAFAPPAPGAPGSPLSPFSLPGRNQWDVALSRAWRLRAGARLGLRADVFNLFNHTQFTAADTVCTAAADETTCAVANTTLGQYTSARAPRQVQLGIRMDWN